MALEGIRAIMEIHFRVMVAGRKQTCWFTMWDLSQVVQNFEIILAGVFTKSSKTDLTCSEKVHMTANSILIVCIVHFPCICRSTPSCVIRLVQFLQHHFMVSLKAHP